MSLVVVNVRVKLTFIITIILIWLFGKELGVAVLPGALSALGDLSQKSLTNATILEGLAHGLPVFVVGFLNVFIEVDLSSNWDFEGLVLSNDAELIANSALGLILGDADANGDFPSHTRGNDTVLKLLNDDTLIHTRLNCNSVTDGVFVLEGKNYFVVSSSSNSTENGLARHHIERAL
jgi:hypothetical protein